MSDYFDGLMRSSGLRLGTEPVLGPSRARTPALPEIENVSTAVAPMTSPVAGPVEAPARGTPAVAASVPAPAGPMLPAVPPAADAPPPAAEPVHAAAAIPTASPIPASPIPAAPPATHDRLVAAAMRWIAAGSDAPSATSQIEAAESPVIPAETPPSRATPRPKPTSLLEITRPDPVLPVAVSPDLDRTARVSAPPSAPPGSARAEPSAATIPPRPPASQPPASHPRDAGVRDEGVQVSIGAIHLRVEAPPAAAVPTPSPAVPRQAPAAPPGTSRSGLSRRALRRI